MYDAGARQIDNSPMYGKSQQVIGDMTSALDSANGKFDEKNETKYHGPYPGVQPYRLENTVAQLRRWKESGKIKYTGITNDTDAHQDGLIQVMKREKPDFVQFNYAIFSRNAEKRLLPAAADLGIATIINRPVGEGKFFSRIRENPLPDWAKAADITNWASFFLKYIIAETAVTCVIPATWNPVHAADDFNAGTCELPGRELRKKMLDYVDRM